LAQLRLLINPAIRKSHQIAAPASPVFDTRLEALKPAQGIDRRGSVNERCEIALTPEPLPLSEIEKILLAPRVTAGEPAGRTDPEAQHA
jgi:hypothetical protein